MQVEFTYAASSATAVAPRNARCGGRAGTGGAAASMMHVCPAGTDARSGHDDETRRPRQLLARISDGTGITVTPAVMIVGMQLAHARTVAIVHDGAVRVWDSSAALTEAVRSDAAFSDDAGSKNGPKKGVMTYDAGMGGREVARHGVAAHVTRS